MKKVIKIGFPILCVAVIGGTFILLNKTTEKINRNRLPKDDNEMISSETDEEKVEVNNAVSTNTVTLTQEEIKAQEVKNKAKAIDIIKKSAPTVSNSYYTNEGRESGKYLVAIRDNTSKNAVIYYAVDIDTGNFEIYVK